MAEDKTTLVFVVSDDPLIRDEASWGFPAGVEVDLFMEARAALDAMRDRPPDVVVVDLQTGSAGGFGLARDMRGAPALAEVPVLILIERAQDGWLGVQSGADRSRLKPLSTAELVTETLSLLPS